MLIFNLMAFLKELDNLRKLTLIDVKLGDSRKGNFYHEEKHYFWKNSNNKLIFLSSHYHRSHCMAQDVKEKNIDVFLLLLQFAIPAAQCSHKIVTKNCFLTTRILH